MAPILEYSACFDPIEHPHRRFNPLKGEWTLVSPHRMRRPWKGQVSKPESPSTVQHDPTNPLCPGVTRSNGVQTPDYESTYVFNNDFPALLNFVPTPEPSEDELFQTEAAAGDCKVMCFHPHTNLTLALMSEEEIQVVINTWVDVFSELSRRWVWVQIFENRGVIMGCSNPHPHCQIWSTSFLPNEPAAKDVRLREYYLKNKSNLLVDYAHKELKKQERLVCQNDDWLVVVPYWAAWPYETMLLPLRHVAHLDELNPSEVISLASIMRELLVKYDNLFKCSFPYSMGWHGAPNNGADNSHWQLHALYLPPLLRSASVRKFMVGFEMLANIQRDLTPEQAAAKLRDLPTQHYSLRSK